MEENTQDQEFINQDTNSLKPNEIIVQERIEEPPKVKPAFFTFNFNTLLGVVAVVGVIVLFILHFSKAPAPEPISMLPVPKASGKSMSVVYVNIDSLNQNYEYIKILRRDLESTGKKLQTEVLNEQAALEREANEFQRQMSSNQISEEKAKQVYEQLMQKQQLLVQKKDQYTQRIAEQEMNMNLKLVDSVTTFLKRFNRDYHFDYIMGYKTGGEILVANDTLEITRTVLDALNKEYQQRKK